MRGVERKGDGKTELDLSSLHIRVNVFFLFFFHLKIIYYVQNLYKYKLFIYFFLNHLLKSFY